MREREREEKGNPCDARERESGRERARERGSGARELGSEGTREGES